MNRADWSTRPERRVVIFQVESTCVHLSFAAAQKLAGFFRSAHRHLTTEPVFSEAQQDLIRSHVGGHGSLDRLLAERVPRTTRAPERVWSLGEGAAYLRTYPTGYIKLWMPNHHESAGVLISPEDLLPMAEGLEKGAEHIGTDPMFTPEQIKILEKEYYESGGCGQSFKETLEDLRTRMEPEPRHVGVVIEVLQ